VKLFSSESANGYAPPIDPDEQDQEFEGSEYDFSTLFNAPSYSEFIKTRDTAKARSYERRVQSMMKAGMVMSLNAHNWPDAATFIKHGPGFAKAAGNLADADPRAANLIDMLTAPDSPVLMFAMVALPMLAQLTRNHQSGIVEAQMTWRERRAERKQAKLQGIKPNREPIKPLYIKLGKKRTIKLPIRFRIKLPQFRNMLRSFLAPTQYPGEIAQEVFTDASVVRALHKMGIFPRGEPAEDDDDDES
jgi:hypothetical protein